MRVEQETRPRDVDAVAERARRVVVDRDPLLVVQRRRRGGRVDERRRRPAEVPRAVERPAVHGDGVRRARAVEAEPRIEDMALGVPRDRRVAARVVRAAREVLDARDERAEVVRVGGGAAPGAAAVVREVRPRIGVAKRAARRPADAAAPCARDVVVRGRDDLIRVVGIDRDRRLVLRGARRVLIHGDVRRQDRVAVERATRHERRRDRGRDRRGCGVLRLLLDERREANLQPGGPVDRGDLAGKRRDVVLRRRRRTARASREQDRRGYA